MRLVQDGGVPVHQGAQVPLPVEAVADHDRPHGRVPTVHLAAEVLVADPVEHRVDLVREEGAQQGGGMGDAAAAGIQEQLAGVGELPVHGIPGPVHPQPVPGAGHHALHVVPVQAAVVVTQPLPSLGPAVADAQIDTGGPRGGDGEGAASLLVHDQAGRGRCQRWGGAVEAVDMHVHSVPPRRRSADTVRIALVPRTLHRGTGRERRTASHRSAAQPPASTWSTESANEPRRGIRST